MKIRIAAKVVPRPCVFLESCPVDCERGKEKGFCAACVPLLQVSLQHRTKIHAEKKYTLDDIALMICQSHSECTEKCVGFEYCSKGKKGTIAWLRNIVGG